MTDTDRQPWHPEGMRLPQVGDRVRVRLGGECGPGHDVGDELDGTIGTVVGILPPDRSRQWRGHNYRVVPRVGAEARTWPYYAILAAAELEVIDDDRIAYRVSDVREHGMHPDNSARENTQALERLIEQIDGRASDARGG